MSLIFTWAGHKPRFITTEYDPKLTMTNVQPSDSLPLYIPPALRKTPLPKDEKPPAKNTAYLTINESQQPLTFFGQYIATEGFGSGQTMTLRNVVDGVGAEMIFHVFSPLVVGFEVIKREPFSDIEDLRFLRNVADIGASYHKEPAKQPLRVWLEKDVVRANVPYLYLGAPMRELDEKKKK